MDDTALPEPSPSETPPDESGPAARSPDAVIVVALIEDNRLVREGITSVLNRFPDLRVTAVEPTGTVTFHGATTPDVILLDAGLESGDSIQIAQDMKKEFAEAGIIVLDVLTVEDDILDFIGLGVSGFVMKNATVDEVANTIRAVARGKDVLPGAMTTTLFSEIAKLAMSRGGSEYSDSVRLTPREREVVDLIAEGMSNKAIGHALHISIHTVKSHMRNIMEKLTLHSRLQVARYALRSSHHDAHRADEDGPPD